MKRKAALIYSVVAMMILAAITVTAQPDTNLLRVVELKSINKLAIEKADGEVYAYLQLGFTNGNAFAVGIRKELFTVKLEGPIYVTPQNQHRYMFDPAYRLWSDWSMIKVTQVLGEGVFLREKLNDLRMYDYSVDTAERIEIKSTGTARTNRDNQTIRIHLGKDGDDKTEARIHGLMNLSGARPFPFTLFLDGMGEFGMELITQEGRKRGWVFTDQLAIEFTFEPQVPNSVIME